MNKLKEILKEKIEFSAGLSTLSNVLRGQGFSYERYIKNRIVLMERPDVVTYIKKKLILTSNKIGPSQ